MKVKLANAPVSWGVDYANDSRNPPWDKVMDEISQAGYRYTELGPYGYYPTDPAILRREFQKRGLAVTAGFVFEPLHEPDQAETVLENSRRTISLLAALGGRYLVTIDHISPDRVRTAGRKNSATRLSERRRKHLVGMIDQIADLALSQGITPAIHQHAGCYLEFDDEIEEVLEALEPSRVGICIDTGHMTYAGIDPIEFYERNRTRVIYFHFKDIDPAVHARVLERQIPFLEAVQERVFCPIGRGVVDWPRLAEVLQKGGYGGVANIEQDIDPMISQNPIDDARASLNYLRAIGF